MDFLTLLQYAPLIIKYAPIVKSIIDESISNEDILTKIQTSAKEVIPLLEDVGKLYPNVAPELKIVAAALAIFDFNLTKLVQNFLNVYLTLNPPLKVDGIPGPKTQAAVAQLQTKLGIKVDGFAGKVTMGFVMKLLTTLPQFQTK